MPEIPRISMSERVADHLREGIHQGRWSGQLPGVPRLAVELDVAPRTVRQALDIMEADGLLVGRGLGRSRSITTGAAGALQRPLRVAILRHDLRLTDSPRTSLFLTEIMHSLQAAGHEVFFCKRSLLELKHDVRRTSRQLTESNADAWVVEAGSRPLLEWCATQATPCLALYGRANHQPLAGAVLQMETFFSAATRHLLELGHRRIVLMLREPHRKPTPGVSARAFLEEMAAHGVSTGAYNLPDWEETPEGFHRLLENLFKLTPPTALIIDEADRVFAAMTYFARRGIKVPEHVSLISVADDPLLDWCYPPIARILWDSSQLVSRVARWVQAVRRGKADRKLVRYATEFEPGSSTGPVWAG